MPVHTLRSQSDDTPFVDGMPVGFSSFEPSAGTDLLDLPADEHDRQGWGRFADPLAPRAAAREEEEDEEFDDDDDDDLWDDDDDDDEDDDFEEDDEDDFDDDDEDPFTLDDDDDDDL